MRVTNAKNANARIALSSELQTLFWGNQLSIVDNHLKGGSAEYERLKLGRRRLRVLIPLCLCRQLSSPKQEGAGAKSSGRRRNNISRFERAI
jgi:hypothetical protein